MLLNGDSKPHTELLHQHQSVCTLRDLPSESDIHSFGRASYLSFPADRMQVVEQAQDTEVTVEY